MLPKIQSKFTIYIKPDCWRSCGEKKDKSLACVLFLPITKSVQATIGPNTQETLIIRQAPFQHLFLENILTTCIILVTYSHNLLPGS